MKTATLLMALLPALAGSLCLYLSSANQLLRVRPLAARPAQLTALVLILLSLSALLRLMQLVAAIFALSSSLMLFLMVLPYLGAWRHLRRRS